MLPDLQLKQHCYDAFEAMEYLRNHQVDLIFLDLNMPKMRGFDFLRSLPVAPKIIVTTAYKEYALEGYELNVCDYLLKPFSFERFLSAVNKALIYQDVRSASVAGPEGNEKMIFIRSESKYIQLKIDDEILYLESSGNYLKVHTVNETITTRDKLSDFLVKLSEIDFIQVHKSFAVAKKIHQIHRRKQDLYWGRRSSGWKKCINSMSTKL